MNNRLIINYTPGSTPLHRLNGATKVLGFAAITVFVIMTFDVRFMLAMFLLCLAGIISMKPNWRPILFMLGFLCVMAGLVGTVMIILVRPGSGLTHVGAETIIFRLSDHFFISKELLWYVGAMFFKRLTSFSTAIIFILAITPSEMAAGMNKLRMPYKICTVFALAFRTIPDIARDYMDIKNSLMMRGVELDSRRISLAKKLRQTVMLLAPLIITSFGKVGTIANAMDLRSYGKKKRRTWYSERPATRADWVARVIILALIAFDIFYITYFRILNPPAFNYWSPWLG